MPSLSDHMFTINFKICRMSDRTRRIGCSAGVLANMAVVNAGNHKHAGTLAKHGGGDAWAGVQFFALETPGDMYGHVTMRNHTS